MKRILTLSIAMLTCIAVSAKITYATLTLTASSSGGGTVAVSKNDTEPSSYSNSASVRNSGGSLTSGSTNDVTFYAFATASEGYYLKGWSTTDGGNIAIAAGSTYTVITVSATGSLTKPTEITYYAVFERIPTFYATADVNFDANMGTCTVGFDAQGTSTHASKSITPSNYSSTQENGNLYFNAQPKSGYIFTGWSTTEGGDIISTNASYNCTMTITSKTSSTPTNYTLYAHFEEEASFYGSIRALANNSGTAVTCYASFTADNYSSNSDNIVLKGSSNNAAIAQDAYFKAVAQEGYLFTGWSTTNGGEVTIFDNPYTTTLNIASHDAAAPTTLTLYAHYEKAEVFHASLTALTDANKGNTYVAFDSDNYQEGNITQSIQATLGSTSANTDVYFRAAAKLGYAFAGWSATEGGDIISTSNPYVTSLSVTSKDASAPTTMTLYANFVEAAQSVTLLRVNETIGDTQGDEYGICTKKEVHFYGVNNLLQRICLYAKEVGTDVWKPMKYTVYKYDTDGHLVETYTQPYGLYDYGDFGFGEKQNVVTYTNNIQGQCIKMESSTGYTEYTYDAQGQLTQEYVVTYSNPANIEQTIVYSDFVNGKPQLTESTGSITSYTYALETEYDANGNKISELKFTWSTTYNELRAKQYEEWTYNEQGVLTDYVLSSVTTNNDVLSFTEKSHTTYEPEEGNSNRIVVTKRTWDNILGKYSNPKTWNIYEYSEMNASQYSPSLTVVSTNSDGTATRLSVVVPNADANTVLNVYRKGIKIAESIAYNDANHFNNGVWSYDDSGLVNGYYEYYVERLQVDASMPSGYVGHNISNIVDYLVKIDLPTVQNLREDPTTRTQKEVSVVDEETEKEVTVLHTIATIHWDAITDTRGFNFQRYDFMVVGRKYAENSETDGTELSWELDLDDFTDYVDVCVHAIYDVGRAESDTIRIYIGDASYELGDVNNDNSVDEQDIPTLVDMVLGRTPINKEADTNEDGKEAPTIGDITKLIYIIQSKQ